MTTDRIKHVSCRSLAAIGPVGLMVPAAGLTRIASRRAVARGLVATAVAGVVADPVAARQRERGFQSGWDLCVRCAMLWRRASDTAIQCPSGRGHALYSFTAFQVGYGRQKPNELGDLSLCQKCRCLWFDLGLTGSCPADGGSHLRAGSRDYFVRISDSLVPGYDANWAGCAKCCCLATFTKVESSFCPAGGDHDLSLTSADLHVRLVL